MKKILLLIPFIILGSCNYAYSQTECPVDKVCVSRETALKALADADTVKAQAAEIKAKNQAISDLKDLLTSVKVQFAEASGENTVLRQRAVSDAALIELFGRMVRPKRIGVNLF